jgi:5-methylcytosine-specific restriction endonuclease McrA
MADEGWRESLHAELVASRSGKRAPRVYDSREWRRLRLAKLQAFPWCEACERAGLLVPATAVDHVKPVSAGGDPLPPLDGLMSLCAPCHNTKTKWRDQLGRENWEDQRPRAVGIDGFPIMPKPRTDSR